VNAIEPGMWVECVDDSPGPRTGLRPLVRGKLYRIRDISTAPTIGLSGRLELGSVKVEGITLPPGPNGRELWLSWRRFRPIYRPSTDLIEGLLKAVPADAPADRVRA
jgi:hypothetical protein